VPEVNFVIFISEGQNMKRLLYILPVAVCLFTATRTASGQRSWSFDLHLGDMYCFKMPLTIEQEGYEKLRFSARYRTESFQLPVYYSWKIGTSSEKRGWELELIHMKLILKNNPPEVQYFAMTHGYNNIFVNRKWETDHIIFRTGMGAILSHPENTVRSMTYNEPGILKRGYHISGPAIQVAAEKRFRIFKGLYFSFEAKVTASVARVGVVEGHAVVNHVGMNGLFGIGYTFD